KDPVESKRDVDCELHGILRLRFGRQAPFPPLRMTAIWKVVHWRSALEGTGRRRGEDIWSRGDLEKGMTAHLPKLPGVAYPPSHEHPRAKRSDHVGAGSQDRTPASFASMA